VETESRAARFGPVAGAIAVALSAVVVVGLVAGAPDTVSDRAAGADVALRLMVVAVGLTVLVGLELVAFSSPRWWVRVLALPVGFLLVLVLFALLDPEPADPPVAPRFGETLSGAGDHMVIRVAPANAFPLTGSEIVATVSGGDIEVYALGGDADDDAMTAARGFAADMDLGDTTGLGLGTAPTRLSTLLEEATRDAGQPEATADPDDPVVVLHTTAGPVVELDIPTATSEPLPDRTIDRLVDGARDLARQGYTVELVIAGENVGVPGGGGASWSALWDDVLALLTDLRWVVLAAGVVLLGALVVGLTRARGPVRRRVAMPEPLVETDDEGARASVAAALDEALDELPLHGDPRAVIAAAYLQMTRALAEHGVTRRAADTPLEYLARALEQLDASSDAVHELTDLLQLAMFSDRPLATTTAEDAIGAFRRVRDELRSPAWV
jgi:hypothetical protein